MTRVQVSRISELDEVASVHLFEESFSPGFRFVERLIQDFSNGVNRFIESAHSKIIYRYFVTLGRGKLIFRNQKQ
jgi:hypothetical protein